MTNTRKKIRKKMRLISALGVLLMTFGIFQPAAAVFAATPKNAWDGRKLTMPQTDENGVFLISAGDELAWFADYVNSGHTDADARLIKSVYLNTSVTTHRWLVIGDSEEHAYKGTFDGNGKQVINMTVELNAYDKSMRYGGLFGVIDGGTVEDLTVTGSIISGYEDTTSGPEHEYYSATGGIAGYLKSGVISGCTNYTETTTEHFCFWRNAGGIVGIGKGLILRCSNRGSVKCTVKGAQYSVGGIAGALDGVKACAIYCDNRADIDGYYAVGGIAGSVRRGAEIAESCDYGDMSGEWYIGGIAGRVTGTGAYSDSTIKECVIRNVYSLGEIKSAISYAAGIVGEMGYADGEGEDNPAMPVIENAYSICRMDGVTANWKAAIISHFKSGTIGNVYGQSGSQIDTVGMKRNKATHINGAAAMLTEGELKEDYMVTRLGDSFVPCTSFYAGRNKGYPLLVWQTQSSTLSDGVNDAIKELLGWLTPENRTKYGENYTLIEQVTDEYIRLIGKSKTKSRLEGFLSEARTKLKAIKPGTDVENELAKAIDDAMTALEAYEDELIRANELTDDQKLELRGITDEYKAAIDRAVSLNEVSSLLDTGKKALDTRISDFKSAGDIENIRAAAMEELTGYESGVEYGEPYASQISAARNRGLRLIKEASAVSAIRTALSEAKDAIDAIIEEIPGTNAWNGTEMTFPEQEQDGFYKISTGAELAWFADRVNSGSTAIKGRLAGDVDLGKHAWTPIGNGAPFKGVFDGGGHTVKGLYVCGQTQYAGLFGIVGGDKDTSVSGLTVKGKIKNDNVRYAAGIAAVIEGGKYRATVRDCHSEVDITTTKVSKAGSAIGGIAGYASNADIDGCSNEGTLTESTEIIAGLPHFVGGLAAVMDKDVNVSRSCNTGAVNGLSTSGGITAYIQGKNCSITACYNTGSVTGTNMIGGLAGGMVYGPRMTGCYTTGKVGNKGLYLGVLFGYGARSDMKNIFALKRPDLTGIGLVAFAEGMSVNASFVSAEELRSDELINRLNMSGNCFVKDYLQKQNGYPLLAWQLTVEQFRNGAISELQAIADAGEYSDENKAVVNSLLEQAKAEIGSAADNDGINVAYSAYKEKLLAVETVKDTEARELAEAKDAAIGTLRDCVDKNNYREEEQILIDRYIADGIKCIAAAETKEEVAGYLADALANIKDLPTASEYQAEEDKAAADNVKSLINQIGEVVLTAYCKMSIDTARAAYDDLTDAQKTLVDNYDVLVKAEKDFAELAGGTPDIHDAALAAIVDRLIGDIGEVSADRGAAIETARAAYNSLTAVQKILVTKYRELTDAEEAYDRLKANEVSAAIADIGGVTLDSRERILRAQTMFNRLSMRQRALVTDYRLLTAAKIKYRDLYAARMAEELISNIGEVTLDSGPKISAAVRVYNELMTQQQDMVTNYDVLVQASERYDQLKAVDATETAIRNIGVVSRASGGFIHRARMSYDALGPALQNSVSNRQVLFDAEVAYAALTGGAVMPYVRSDGMTDPQASDPAGASSAAASEGGAINPHVASDEPQAPETFQPVPYDEDIITDDYSYAPTADLREKGALTAKQTTLVMLILVAAVLATAVTVFAAGLKKGSDRRKDKMVHY